jgi:hypothetical protein
MNASNHRFLTALATIATLGVAAFAIGIAFDVHPMALFSVAASALILLGAARDYASTLAYSTSSGHGTRRAVPARRTDERNPLAA